MHKRGLCRHAVCVYVSVCLCVCVSVTFVSCVKTNKDIFEIFSPSGSQAILVFPCQTGWRYSDRNPLTGTSNAGGVDKKTRFWTNIWLRCIQIYSVVNRTNREVSKTKPRRTAASVEHSPRRPSSVVRTRRRRSVYDGLDVIHRRGGQPPPGHNPLVITPFSAAVGHRRTEPCGYFVDTNPYSSPYPTHEAGS